MIYVDNAATSFPKPDVVKEEMLKYFSDFGANPGRSGHEMAVNTGREIYKTRMVVNNFFNGENPLNWAFCQNATEALNMGIRGVLTKGDHAICTCMDHNSVLRPLHELEKEGIELTIVNADNEGFVKPENIEKEIKNNTKLIVTTHASNLTGTVQDIYGIAKIASKYKIIYLVDAAQTAGAYKIDLKESGINLLAITGHKSLLGPQGIGALYVSNEVKLKPIKAGGTGSKSNELLQPIDMPDLLEVGTPNTIGILGLKASIQYINEVKIDNIINHEKNILKIFLDEVSKIENYEIYGTFDLTKRMPVVAINHKKIDSSELSYILNDEYEIATRPGLHCAPLAHKNFKTLETGATRFSFGYNNTVEEINRCIDALKKIDETIGGK
jgi:cysteine desulfurase family protein